VQAAIPEIVVGWGLAGAPHLEGAGGGGGGRDSTRSVTEQEKFIGSRSKGIVVPEGLAHDPTGEGAPANSPATVSRGRSRSPPPRDDRWVATHPRPSRESP
jgi:hypothetical protein